MRCAVGLIVVLGACGFHALPGASPTPPDAIADDATSVPATDATTAGDAAAGDAAPTGPFCDPKDSHLIACYDFEGDAHDGSKNKLDANTHDVAFVAGKVGMAMQFADTSSADTDNKNALDVQALTVEAWINPSQLPPPTTAVFIVDVDRQYALQLYGDGSVVCALVDAPFKVPATTQLVPVNQWTHVACTYDSAGAAAYINGVSTVPVTGGVTLGTQGNTGLSIAADNNPTSPSRSRMIGMIDQLRLMDIARTPAQICADAGRSSCP